MHLRFPFGSPKRCLSIAVRKRKEVKQLYFTVKSVFFLSLNIILSNNRMTMVDYQIQLEMGDDDHSSSTSDNALHD